MGKENHWKFVLMVHLCSHFYNSSRLLILKFENDGKKDIFFAPEKFDHSRVHANKHDITRNVDTES